MKPCRFARASLLVVACACASNADRIPPVSSYDSAGTRIVITAANAPREEWRLEAAPRLDLADTASPARRFSRIRGLAELADGRIVVADDGSCQVRYFSATAEPLLQVGRCGRAPGEFASLWLVGRSNDDALLVWDFAIRRFTWLGAAGQLLDLVEWADSTESVTAWQLYADGRVLATLRPAATRPGPAVTQDTTVLWDLDPRTLQRRALVQKPGVMWWTSARGRESVPFTGNAVFALSGDDAVIGAGSEHAIERWSRAAILLSRYVLAQPAEPLKAAEIAEYRDGELRSLDAGEARTRLAEWNALPWPHQRLAWDRLLGGPAGQVWARHFEWRNDREHHWTVFDSAGVAVAHVRAPAFLEITEVHEDHVLGHGQDEQGREHAWIYGLLKPRPPAGQRQRS